MGRLNDMWKTYTVCSVVWKSIRQSPEARNYWYIRDKGVLENHPRLAKDMYHQGKTIVGCAAGTSEPFTVAVGLHQ